MSRPWSTASGGGQARLRRDRGGARPVRGRSRHGEDRARACDRADDLGRRVLAHPVHAGPAADRRHRALHLQPADAGLRVPAGADLRERHPRRRDQPRDAEDAVGAARGDGGAAGDGRRRDARPPDPFLLLATENPIEHEGTFPLPEAQLDRFFLKTALGYPPSRRSCRSSREQRSRPPARRLEPAVRVETSARSRRRSGRLRRQLSSAGSSSSSRHAHPRRGRDRRLGPRQPRARARGACVGVARMVATTSSRRTSTAFRAGALPPCRVPPTFLAEARRVGWTRPSTGSARVPRAAPRPEPDRRRVPPAPERARALTLTFPLVPRRRLLGLAVRRDATARVAAGSDVAGSRPYRPGDDARDRLGRVGPTLLGARRATSSSCASTSPRRRRASSSWPTAARRWALPGATALARESRGGAAAAVL